jgi:hypothetical protein
MAPVGWSFNTGSGTQTEDTTTRSSNSKIMMYRSRGRTLAEVLLVSTVMPRCHIDLLGVMMD